MSSKQVWQCDRHGYWSAYNTTGESLSPIKDQWLFAEEQENGHIMIGVMTDYSYSGDNAKHFCCWPCMKKFLEELFTPTATISKTIKEGGTE